MLKAFALGTDSLHFLTSSDVQDIVSTMLGYYGTEPSNLVAYYNDLVNVNALWVGYQKEDFTVYLFSLTCLYDVNQEPVLLINLDRHFSSRALDGYRVYKIHMDDVLHQYEEPSTWADMVMACIEMDESIQG